MMFALKGEWGSEKFILSNISDMVLVGVQKHSKISQTAVKILVFFKTAKEAVRQMSAIH